LISPVDYFELILDMVPPYTMTKYVVRTIQDAHGDLNREMSQKLWPNQEWIPLTELGQELKAEMELPPLTILDDEIDGEVNVESYRTNIGLIRYIVQKAYRNIGCANMLLEIPYCAESMNDIDIWQSFDRLPQTFISFFDRAINDILKQDDHIARLGIEAIKEVGSARSVAESEHVNLSFTDLKEKLKHLQPFTMEEMLYAARGLLSAEVVINDPERWEDCFISGYIYDFELYAAESYNKLLV
jgi:hypothetical protein